MEYQKVIILLDNTPNQPSRFRTKRWFKINDDSRGTYNSQIKLKTSMLKSIFFYYSDAYILVNRIITITGEGANDANQADEGDKEVILKNHAPFTDCISEINNTQEDMKIKSINRIIVNE